MATNEFLWFEDDWFTHTKLSPFFAFLTFFSKPIEQAQRGAKPLLPQTPPP